MNKAQLIQKLAHYFILELGLERAPIARWRLFSEDQLRAYIARFQALPDMDPTKAGEERLALYQALGIYV